jgi:hypothetical protein
MRTGAPGERGPCSQEVARQGAVVRSRAPATDVQLSGLLTVCEVPVAAFAKCAVQGECSACASASRCSPRSDPHPVTRPGALCVGPQPRPQAGASMSAMRNIVDAHVARAGLAVVEVPPRTTRPRTRFRNCSPRATPAHRATAPPGSRANPAYGCASSWTCTGPESREGVTRARAWPRPVFAPGPSPLGREAIARQGPLPWTPRIERRRAVPQKADAA